MNFTRQSPYIGLGLLLAAQLTVAQTFNDGIPAGWTSVGSTGTSGADGVVGLSGFSGSTAYGWVSTAGSTATGVGFGLGDETNGSSLTSSAFSASAGTPLKFSFDFVTSDGAGYSDYAFAELLNATTGKVAAVLFDARTEPSGTIAPGVGLPTPVATLTPSSVPIIGGAPTWAPLGGSSGTCFAAGCGYTGWVGSTYDIPTAGTYKLEFGVTNWIDTAYDTGLAFDGLTVGGKPIGPPTGVPEIDMTSAASGVVLLIGGVMVLRGRRMKLPGKAAV